MIRLRACQKSISQKIYYQNVCKIFVVSTFDTPSKNSLIIHFSVHFIMVGNLVSKKLPRYSSLITDTA